MVSEGAVGGEHEDLVIFEPVEHPQPLDDQLQRAWIALPTDDATKLSGLAESARDFGKVLDVLERLGRELYGAGHVHWT